MPRPLEIHLFTMSEVSVTRALSTGGGGGGVLRTERWLKRQLLTRAPKSAEEIALDDKEVRLMDKSKSFRLTWSEDVI